MHNNIEQSTKLALAGLNLPSNHLQLLVVIDEIQDMQIALDKNDTETALKKAQNIATILQETLASFKPFINEEK